MAEQDRYEPKERLATGLGGERWRALDTSTGTDVVLAVLDARTATAAERTRFATVADVGAGLAHPGLEKVIDRGTTSLGNPFAAHEIVEAPTFAKRIETNPPWSIHEVVRVGTSMLDALSAAHAAGLVHGDLEPERVQVLPAGRARVICFDLSRASQRIADDAWHGSFAYMSPEQANGEPPTAASDVYGVGALIYRCITGIPPRALPDGTSSRERIIDTRLAEIRALRGEIPVALATAVEKALASDPKARFTSAAELRKALTSALILSPTVARMHVRGGPTAATPSTSDRPAARPITAKPSAPVKPAAPPKPAAPKPRAPNALESEPAPKPDAAPEPTAQKKPSSPPPATKPKSVAPPKLEVVPKPTQEPEELEELEELEPVEEEDEPTQIRMRSEPPPPPVGEPVPGDDDEDTVAMDASQMQTGDAGGEAPSEEAAAEEVAEAPKEEKPEITTIARVQVKQLNVPRPVKVAEEQVEKRVRRKDPRAEPSDPPPRPAPVSVQPPALKKLESVPPTPSPFVSDRPPAEAQPSNGRRWAMGALAVGAVVAAFVLGRQCGAKEVVVVHDAPPPDVREPIDAGAAVVPPAPMVEDAAVTAVVEDASVAEEDAAVTAEATPPPVVSIPAVEAPPPSTAMTTMSTAMVAAPVMQTVPTMTTATEMTAASVMTDPPVMTTPMTDTGMRHIEVDPGF